MRSSASISKAFKGHSRGHSSRGHWGDPRSSTATPAALRDRNSEKPVSLRRLLQQMFVKLSLAAPDVRGKGRRLIALNRPAADQKLSWVRSQNMSLELWK
jgi:hypothetical protein